MPKGEIIGYSEFLDSDVNENEKIVTPNDLGHYDYQLTMMHIAYTSDATVGNRLLAIELLDPEDVQVYHFHPNTFQDNNKLYHYYCIPGAERDTLSTVDDIGVDGTIIFPFPREFVITKGYTLKVRDEANISSGDDFIIRGQVRVLR